MAVEDVDAPIPLLLALLLWTLVSGLQAQGDAVKLVLKNGNVLEGRLLEESEDYLCIELAPGQRMGFERRRVAKIHRLGEAGSGKALDRKKAVEAMQKKLRLCPRSDWFRIQDAGGKVVGTLHLVAMPEAEDRYRFEESWFFLEKVPDRMGRAGNRHLQSTLVSRIERVDGEGRPHSYHLREAVLDLARDRVVQERVVQGTVEEGRLRIQETSMSGKSERLQRLREGTGFGLFVEERLRQGVFAEARSYHATIWDPVAEGFVDLTYALEPGEPIPASRFPEKTPRKGRVLRIRSTLAGRARAEWIADGGGLLLLEINGIDLVAEPIAAQTARSLRASRKMDLLLMSPTRQELGGYEWNLPRATWRFVRKEKGVPLLRLVPSRPEVRVRLRRLNPPPGIEGGLAAQAPALIRRWRLDHEWIQEEKSGPVQLRGREVWSFEGSGRPEGGLRQRGLCWVFPALEGAVVLEVHGPEEAVADIRDEVEELLGRMRRSGEMIGRGD